MFLTSGILKLFGMHHEDLESDVSEEEIKSFWKREARLVYLMRSRKR